jgi:hypothetical protein
MKRCTCRLGRTTARNRGRSCEGIAMKVLSVSCVVWLGLAVGGARADMLVLDFEADGSGAPLLAGTIIDDEFALLGVHVYADNAVACHPDLAIIFDSAHPTGGDSDLQTPGWHPSNTVPYKNVLIIAENAKDCNHDGRVDVPDDEGGQPAGYIKFTFDRLYHCAHVVLIDTEECGGTIKFYRDTDSVGSVSIPKTADNAVTTVTFDGAQFDKMKVNLAGSGAIAEVSLCGEEPECRWDSDCDDGDVCTDDRCVDGACVYSWNNDPCDDGDACTKCDKCSNGSCTGSPVTCNDHNPCTDDTCDSELGCQYVNNTKPCDDGDACTVDDVCADGKCDGTEKQCDDGLYCTGDESCDPQSGECVSDGDPCPWGTFCNEETHECEEYECRCFDPISVTVDCTSTNGAPVEFPEFHYTPLCLFVCEDTEGKTIACPPSCEISCYVGTNAVSSGDVFPVGTTKVECEIGFDGGETTTTGIGLSRTCEFFVTVTCLPPPPPPPPPSPQCTHDDQCDDGVDCTTDHCVSGHCEFTPDDALCDDGDLCTTDQCDPVNGCLHEPVTCPEDQVCDPASGQCVECLNDDDCEDGSFCNGAETCVDGVCQDGTPPCPEEFCDEVNDVCAEVPAPAPLTECEDDGDCDDGLFCTGAETCVDGVCQNGTPPCSEDLCDEENDLCAEPSGDGTLGSGQGAGPRGTRGGCGLFNGVALLVLPLGMLLWMGLRSHSRRRI